MNKMKQKKSQSKTYSNQKQETKEIAKQNLQ